MKELTIFDLHTSPQEVTCYEKDVDKIQWLYGNDTVQNSENQIEMNRNTRNESSVLRRAPEHGLPVVLIGLALLILIGVGIYVFWNLNREETDKKYVEEFGYI